MENPPTRAPGTPQGFINLGRFHETGIGLSHHREMRSRCKCVCVCVCVAYGCRYCAGLLPFNPGEKVSFHCPRSRPPRASGRTDTQRRVDRSRLPDPPRRRNNGSDQLPVQVRTLGVWRFKRNVFISHVKAHVSSRFDTRHTSAPDWLASNLGRDKLINLR